MNMTTEESLEKLRDIIREINIAELREYLSQLKLDEIDRNNFATNYLYGSKRNGETETGLVPLLLALLETFPVDLIPRDKLRERIKATEIEKRLESCNRNIEMVDEELAKADAANREAKVRMEELKLKHDELKRKQDSGADYKMKIGELEEAIRAMESENVQLSKAEAESMSKLFDDPDAARNYEQFLSSCLKAREMTLPKDMRSESAETENARIIHVFMLLKWYLTNSPQYDDETFHRRYEEIMRRIATVNEESKAFFRDYMDATAPAVERID